MDRTDGCLLILKEQMQNGFLDAKEQIENLARMIANGFHEVDERFDLVHKDIKN